VKIVIRVLVTGGCGFLGSHVCDYYRTIGDEVVAFDNLTKHELSRTGFAIKDARLHNWNFLKEIGVVLSKGDIQDKNSLAEAANGCNYIVHTAAQPAMTISVEEPELDLLTNVVGTFNILALARSLDVPVANCSTIHVYGNEINQTLSEQASRFVRDPPDIGETSPTLKGKVTPLHASKISAETYVNAFVDTYGLKAANLRFTGMYGPRQFGGEDHGWVANFAIRTVLDLPIKIYGTGKQVRDILYASDAAASFDAFFRVQRPGTYNIGGGMKNSISLMECLDILRRMTHREQRIEAVEPRDMDLWYFVSDISKAKRELGWEPNVPNEEGIGNLVGWIRKNQRLFEGQRRH
jgi:CDP-paratose 2-epimerase